MARRVSRLLYYGRLVHTETSHTLQRKNRTQKADTAKAAGDGKPKSFVLHAGEVGSSVKALSRDLRQVMEPNTAARLRVCP